MKKFVVVPVAVVLIFAWLGISDAMMCNGCMGRDSGMGAEGDHMFMKLRSLGLDSKQMEEVKAIHFRTMKETIKKKADLQVARLELREVLGRDPVDLRAAEAKVRQIEVLSGDLRMMRIRAFEEVKGRLTPDQKAKLEEMNVTTPMMGREMTCGMPGRCGMMKDRRGCGKCGMMDPDGDEDMGHACMPGHTDEMPATDHQHMHHAK